MAASNDSSHLTHIPPWKLAGGYALMFLTAALWAGAWITAKLAAFDAPPRTVSVGRLLLGAVALVPLWALVPRKIPPAKDKAVWGSLVAMAALGGALYNILFLVGERLAPASDGGALTPAICGVSVALLTWSLNRERPAWRALAGLGLSITGIALVASWTSGAGAGAQDRLLGDVLYVGAGLAFGVYTVLNRRIANRIDAVSGVLAVNILATLMLLPAALIHEGVPDVSSWSTAAIVNVLYLGIASSAVASTTFFLAVKILGPWRVAPALGLVPLLTAGAAIFIDERVTLLHVLGGLLILLGVFANARTAKAAPPPLPTPAAPASGGGAS